MNRGTKLTWAAAGSVACTAALMALRASRRLDLRDKVVVVTGGSRGLGLVLAREFVGRGSKVAICARNQEELGRVRDEFALLGERFIALQCDLTQQDEVAVLIEDIERHLGPIDVLVNNAGVIQFGPLENLTIEDFHDAMDTNFWAAVHTTLAVLPGMKRRRSGRIVNIASIGGKVAVPHLLPYCASKFALMGFSKGVRAEVAMDGVMVTTVAPGLMRTGSPRNAEIKGQHSKEYGWFILGDSLPGTSMDARTAARKIVRACVDGTGEVILGIPATLAAMANALAPNVFGMLMAGANRWMLPSPGNTTRTRRGRESENFLTRSFLMALTRRAEIANNELCEE